MQNRLLRFAVDAGAVADNLARSHLGVHVCKQLIRSATSPAPNYAEACAAESRRDFIHKLSICLKELRESRVWLELILLSNLNNQPQVKRCLEESEELSKIIAQSIITAKKNKNLRQEKP